eukprot:10365130-Alexandrium_andersonii.AAC.1
MRVAEVAVAMSSGRAGATPDLRRRGPLDPLRRVPVGRWPSPASFCFRVAFLHFIRATRLPP